MRWLGWDSGAPAIGLEVRDDALYLALARESPTRIVGLGSHRLEPGVVVGGDTRQPAKLVEAIDALIAPLHRSSPPAITVAVAPSADGEGMSTAMVNDPEPIGSASASTRLITTIAGAAGRIGTPVSVDSVPVAVARFHRFSRLRASELFARAGHSGTAWTMCLSNGALEVEVTEMTHGAMAVTIGPDLGSLTAPQWGALPIDKAVRREFGEPGPWTVAVGAALGALGRFPVVDLIGPGVTTTDASLPATGWAVEPIVGASPVLRGFGARS